MLIVETKCSVTHQIQKYYISSFSKKSNLNSKTPLASDNNGMLAISHTDSFSLAFFGPRKWQSIISLKHGIHS